MNFIFAMALPLSLIWMLLTVQVNWEGFVVGYGISLIILYLLRPEKRHLNWRRLPDQILALLAYLIILYWDIFLSGLDIARRVLSPDMQLNPGVVAVPLQDPENNALITALSADAISLIPGELVIEIEDNSILYVHTLNVDETVLHAASKQAERLQLLNRILGRNQT